jgi:hypothetical protein
VEGEAEELDVEYDGMRCMIGMTLRPRRSTAHPVPRGRRVAVVAACSRLADWTDILTE